MNNHTFEQALEEIHKADSFILSTHTHPDGDALGTMLGCAHFLQALGKSQIRCVIEDEVPNMYQWLPGIEWIEVGPVEPGNADLFVIVDVAQLERIGTAQSAMMPNQRTLVLDHHLEDSPCGNINVMCSEFASASELVIALYERAEIPISKEAAECLYVGISTDTGGFRYANTTADTHRHAQVLLESGVDVSTISSRVFETLSRAKLELLRIILGRMVVGAEGAYAYSYLTLSDIEDCNAVPEDVEGLVNYPRNLAGVRVGALYREIPDGKTKVSLRSQNDFNSAHCLQAFGGGGHAGAAGATLDMPLKVALDAVGQGIRTQIKTGVNR
jgi:phosphoesterase RecJ-like protein